MRLVLLEYMICHWSLDPYNSVRQLNQWDISLYDVQTTTNITLNQPTTLSTPTYIKGLNSGATAFLKDSVTAGAGLNCI